MWENDALTISGISYDQIVLQNDGRKSTW